MKAQAPEFSIFCGVARNLHENGLNVNKNSKEIKSEKVDLYKLPCIYKIKKLAAKIKMIHRVR